MNLIFSSDALKRDLFSVLNFHDHDDSVPLHYASKFWPQSIVYELLRRGAISSVGAKNDVNEQPLNKIKPEVNLHMLLCSFDDFK